MKKYRDSVVIIPSPAELSLFSVVVCVIVLDGCHVQTSCAAYTAKCPPAMDLSRLVDQRLNTVCIEVHRCVSFLFCVGFVWLWIVFACFSSVPLLSSFLGFPRVVNSMFLVSFLFGLLALIRNTSPSFRRTSVALSGELPSVTDRALVPDLFRSL